MRRRPLSLPAVPLAALCLLAACEQSKGRPPVARLQITPRYVPIGVESTVTLDARRSCDEVDFPETCDKTTDGPGPVPGCPGGVTFGWILDAPFSVAPGFSLTESKIDILITPQRPVRVTLEVVDCDNNKTTTSTHLGVTEPYPDAGVPDAGSP